MLLGHPDVKADVMITRYLHRELDLSRAPTREEARTIVTEAAERLEMSSLDLDHAIWSFERTAANRQERSGPLANRRN
jgi:exonuclease VII small subunit